MTFHSIYLSIHPSVDRLINSSIHFPNVFMIQSPESDSKVRTPTLTFEDGVCDEKDHKSKESANCSDPVFRYNVIDTIFLFWNTTTMVRSQSFCNVFNVESFTYYLELTRNKN